ncbi:uncharacterized protein EDB91DRAFT_1346091 [Suillus paluster]|uniref:uncharacterized protein n=1 Tax=Suillus paluster TaxID=48578 RepID=UPI001B880217|nr:uncharacterized protein EDB91DRAFT_1346091 [Suillus paluster]KAG1744056.1 hypothetical protein EDB91DRAFT_1346091 [Suillus paluster]
MFETAEIDEGHLEARDGAPDAPKLLHILLGEFDVKTLFDIYRPWCHTILIFAPNPADATPILAALESYDKHVVRSAVIMPSSSPATPAAFPADLVEGTQTKVFIIRPDGVIGAIVRGGEGVTECFSTLFRNME